jgi:hypothetical protein
LTLDSAEASLSFEEAAKEWPIAQAIWERVDFTPAESTAPEAPGA